MQISISNGQLVIQSPVVALRGMRPVVNGAAYEDAEMHVLEDEVGLIELRWALKPLGRASLQVWLQQRDDTHASLGYRIQNLPDGFPLDSFGVRFEQLENLRLYLRSGYTSWDGSEYVEPEAMREWSATEPRPETGFAMTQLLPRLGAGALVVGFDRHDRFQHTFTFDTRRVPPTLTVQTWWDRKSGTSAESERLVLFEHDDVEASLREWARVVAAASPLPPRRAEPITGWCSWYNLYAYITEENILEHLRAAAAVAARERLPMRVFQIDDGFTPEMGDWLEVKPEFPRGMKPLMDTIRASGFTPGLWIAPFMVGNRSRLYREHPDWVVRERDRDAPLVQWRLYAEFRWHKRSEEYYILDTTHPEAFEYLRQVFRAWRREWGCEYFKTDFMFWGAEHGPRRARWHAESLTRIEIWRRVGEMIRQEIGDATWLGSGAPLWASVGLVDGNRIGSDVGVEWRGHLSAQSLLRDLATRNFANHILWQIDPDCVLLRERFHHLAEAEVRTLALFAGMSGGVMMTSDHLGELSPARLRLWRLLLNPARATCRFPFLGLSPITYEREPAGGDRLAARHVPVSDPARVQVRGEGDLHAVLVFNTSEEPIQRTYPWNALGLPGRLHAYDWIAGAAFPGPVEEMAVTVPPHDGTLWFVSPSPITAPPEQLP